MNIHRINDFVERINRLLIGVAVVFLVVTVAIVIANVVSRYVLHVSLTWSAELARYSMVWSSLLAAAVLVNMQQHLSVDILEKYMPARLRFAAQLVIHIGSMTFFFILLVSGCLLVMRTSGQVASSIEMLPMNAVYVIMPVTALLMLLGSFVVLLRTLCGEEPMR